jgi:hypothetical protein
MNFFRNWTTGNYNSLFRPCLLTDWDDMNKLHTGHSIDVSYQVSVHLAERLQRGKLKRRTTGTIWRSVQLGRLSVNGNLCYPIILFICDMLDKLISRWVRVRFWRSCSSCFSFLCLGGFFVCVCSSPPPHSFYHGFVVFYWFYDFCSRPGIFWLNLW